MSPYFGLAVSLSGSKDQAWGRAVKTRKPPPPTMCCTCSDQRCQEAGSSGPRVAVRPRSEAADRTMAGPLNSGLWSSPHPEASCPLQDDKARASLSPNRQRFRKQAQLTIVREIYIPSTSTQNLPCASCSRTPARPDLW